MANANGKRRRFGAVRKLPSGRWQARYRDPSTGLLRSAEQTYPSKRDAEIALTHLEADILRGQWSDPDAENVPFGEYADAWLRDRKLAVRSRERHEVVLRLHIKPTLGGTPLARITTARVRSWRAELLAAGVGEPTVVKAYQILRAIMSTAVDDELVRRNPCRIRGADSYEVPERPVLSVPQVLALADAIVPRYRVLVLLAAFGTLRFGELAAMRRRDLDLSARLISVQRSQAETQDGQLVDKAPKSAAGTRTVGIPEEIVPDIRSHLDRYSDVGHDGHVFLGVQGGRLRRSNFRAIWIKALKSADLPSSVHFHDLRHTGNTLASNTGASTRELMTRMGHSTSRAALIYQHVAGDRDRAIADGLGTMIRETRDGGDSNL